MDPNTILTSIGTTLITNLVSDKNSGPLRTLNDVWDFSIGTLIHSIAEKKRAKYAVDVEAYKKEIEKEVLSIPPENLIEPPLSIIGPALEASKYYIEEKALRSMFAKLVASSMDDRKTNNVHPAFIEMIKQLTPLEAEIISSFNKKRMQPIVNIGFRDYNNSSFYVMYGNFYLINGQDFTTLQELTSSITNLLRLGVVSISYALSLHNEEYINFEQSVFYQYICVTKSKEAEEIEKIVDLEKGIIETSPLGYSFVQIVCGD